MVGFAKAVKGTNMHNQIHGSPVGFSRGDKGFFLISTWPTEGNFYTGLPSGDYCNVIQGCPTSSGCEGDTIHVDGGGNAYIKIPDHYVPMAAIHVGMLSLHTLNKKMY